MFDVKLQNKEQMKHLQKFSLFVLFAIMGAILAIRYYSIGKHDQAVLLFIQYLLLGFLIYPTKESFKEFSKMDWLIKILIFITYAIVVYLNYKIAIR